jgi:uncharacterized protein (TIGR00730 family)
MRSVCVFLSSSPGRPGDVRAIENLAREIVARGLTLVYGGAHRGLMGVLADAALAAGGRVVGVIPQALVDIEVAHTGLSELHVVETMHQRKAKMFALAEAFVVAPGGFGTLEEAPTRLPQKADGVPRHRGLLVAARGVPRSRGGSAGPAP